MKHNIIKSVILFIVGLYCVYAGNALAIETELAENHLSDDQIYSLNLQFEPSGSDGDFYRANRVSSEYCPYSKDESKLTPFLGKIWKFSFTMGSKEYVDYIDFDYEISGSDNCPSLELKNSLKNSKGETGQIGWTTELFTTDAYMITINTDDYIMLYLFKKIDGIKISGGQIQFRNKDTFEMLATCQTEGKRILSGINQFSGADDIVFSENIQDLKFLEGTKWSISSDDSASSNTTSLARTIIFGIAGKTSKNTATIHCESDIGAGNFYYITTNNIYAGGFEGTKTSENYVFDIYDNKLYGIYTEEKILTGEDGLSFFIVGELIPECRILSKATIQIPGSDEINTAPVRVIKDPVGNLYSLDISFPCYTEAVDIYAALMSPDGLLNFIQNDGRIDFELVPLAKNTSEPISFSFSEKEFPKGNYTFYWAVLPANGGDLLSGDWSGPSILGWYPYSFK